MNHQSASVNWAAGCRTDDTRVIFHVSRIDNREELAGKLGVSSQLADAALLTAAYRKFGQDSPKHILGDFAFAIWDATKREVFAARDPSGCQPVYYHHTAQRFAISDSVEQLLSVSNPGRDLDEPFVATILSRTYSHPERTYLTNVHKIPAAHSVVIRQDSITLKQYWRPEDITQVKWRDGAECGEAFRQILRQAVQDRLPTVGRLGVHLSGGLDCSSVTAFAADALRRDGKAPPLAFAWQPPKDHSATGCDHVKREYERIESVCEQEGLEPVFCRQTKQDFLDVLRRDDTVRHICGGTYGEWIVQKAAAARNVTTIMSGFGGDEAASFAGGGYYAGLALRGRWKTLYKSARVQGLNPLRFGAGQLATGLEHLLLPDRIFDPYLHARQHMRLPRWRSLVRAMVNPNSAHLALTSNEQKDLYEQKPYLSADFLKRVVPLPKWKPMRKTSAHAVQCQWLQQGHLVNRIESWAADGAQRGIRYVYPLLDRRVLEFALSIPEDSFTDGNWNRLFFRQAMDPVLPRNVCWERVNTEPSRSNTLCEVAKEGFGEVGKMLRAGAINSPRAQYLDMARLTRDLQPEALATREKMGRLFFAVQFLGIEGA